MKPIAARGLSCASRQQVSNSPTAVDRTSESEAKVIAPSAAVDAVAAQRAAPDTGSLVLTVRCSITKWGETLAVAGEGNVFGAWGAAPAGPLSLRCVDSATGEVMWPRWTLEVPIQVTSGQLLEYKYLVSGKGGEKWETKKVGEHRRLVVTEAVLQAGVHDDGEFGCVLLQDARANDAGIEVGCNETVGLEIVSAKGTACEGEGSSGVGTIGGASPAPLGSRSEPDGEVAPLELALPQHRQLQRIGKGKQGRCFLVELEDGQRAVLKELKGGGRLAYRAEVDSLVRLRGSAAAIAGTVPQLLGAAPKARQVLMSQFVGTTLPDSNLAPALRGGLRSTLYALQCWLDVANAVEEANTLGIVHCDVNPWNILISEQSDHADCADCVRCIGRLSVGANACLVDWACAHCACDAAKSLPFSKRGDFQAAELLKGRVGPRTDVFGCAATLLWLLARRTRKSLIVDNLSISIAELFATAAEGAPQIAGADTEATLQALVHACAWGLEEDWDARCPQVGQLLARVAALVLELELMIARCGVAGC